MIILWRHHMETFSALLALCVGNPAATGGFPSQRPVTQSFDVFFNLCMSKQLNKQLRHRWFETPSHSLWHHCNNDVHIEFCLFMSYWIEFIPRRVYCTRVSKSVSHPLLFIVLRKVMSINFHYPVPLYEYEPSCKSFFVVVVIAIGLFE